MEKRNLWQYKVRAEVLKLGGHLDHTTETSYERRLIVISKFRFRLFVKFWIVRSKCVLTIRVVFILLHFFQFSHFLLSNPHGSTYYNPHDTISWYAFATIFNDIHMHAPREKFYDNAMKYSNIIALCFKIIPNVDIRYSICQIS